MCVGVCVGVRVCVGVLVGGWRVVCVFVCMFVCVCVYVCMCVVCGVCVCVGERREGRERGGVCGVEWGGDIKIFMFIIIIRFITRFLSF